MSLKQLLAEQRSDIALTAAGLEGPGAEVLRAAAQDARYVVMGEDHGVAEIAQAAAALYRMIQPLGFDTLAVEVGAYAADELTRILASDAPVDRMRAYIGQYPFSIAFYNWREELDFLRQAAALSGGGFRLIGFDQELMGASRLLLEKALASSPEAQREELSALLAEEAACYQRASADGNPMELFMMQVDADRLRALRDELQRAGAPGAAALTALLESREIYAAMGTDVYLSNARRARYMKRALMSALEGRQDRLMLKTGAYHGYKGWAPMRTREIGATLAELADAHGARSLHVIVLGAGGTQLTFAGIGNPAASEPLEVHDEDYDLPGAVPLLELAADRDGWSLFDLRALRPGLGDMEAVAPATEHLLLGYDLAIVIPEVTAASEI